MPYVDLPNAHDDYASLWYLTNSSTGTVGGFDSAKATVLLLHPQFLDSAWLSAQFEDPRLATYYNLIALDARHAGQTSSRLNGKQDSWTDAADVAFALEVRKTRFPVLAVALHIRNTHTHTPPAPTPLFPLRRDGQLITASFRYFRHSVSRLFMSGHVNCSRPHVRCVLLQCELVEHTGSVFFFISVFFGWAPLLR